MDRNTRTEVLEQIRRKGRGWVFTVRDFPETHDPEAVRATLRKLQRAGHLKKITTGVFHFPRKIRDLDVEVPPDPMKVAKAVARLRGHRIALSGAAAANRLGLTTQVPAKTVYLTDGPSKEIQLGKMTIALHHAPAECVRVGGDLERAIVQAILYLGREGMDDKAILKLRRAVPPARRNRLLAAARRVGGWVGEVLQQIAIPSDDVAVGHG